MLVFDSLFFALLIASIMCDLFKILVCFCDGFPVVGFPDFLALLIAALMSGLSKILSCFCDTFSVFFALFSPFLPNSLLRKLYLDFGFLGTDVASRVTIFRLVVCVFLIGNGFRSCSRFPVTAEMLLAGRADLQCVGLPLLRIYKN